jgi:hypothetical protein
MKSLPLPVRLAAGLAVTALEQARKLPEQLTGLPVTVVSQALQISMRVQQQVTELAIKGDEALAMLRPAGEDTPEWATFDEDETDEAEDTNDPFAADPFEPDPEDETDSWLDEEEDDAPTFLPGYAEMTLPQLRSRMRRLSLDELEELIGYEREHADRPEFVATLTRRIATVRANQ